METSLSLIFLKDIKESFTRKVDEKYLDSAVISNSYFQIQLLILNLINF